MAENRGGGGGARGIKPFTLPAGGGGGDSFLQLHKKVFLVPMLENSKVVQYNKDRISPPPSLRYMLSLPLILITCLTWLTMVGRGLD